MLSPVAEATPRHCGASRRLLLKAHTAGHASGLLRPPPAQNAPALESVTKSVACHPLLQVPRSRPSSRSLEVITRSSKAHAHEIIMLCSDRVMQMYAQADPKSMAVFCPENTDRHTYACVLAAVHL